MKKSHQEVLDQLLDEVIRACSLHDGRTACDFVSAYATLFNVHRSQLAGIDSAATIRERQ